jgi:hypothetical protein
LPISGMFILIFAVEMVAERLAAQRPAEEGGRP